MKMRTLKDMGIIIKEVEGVKKAFYEKNNEIISVVFKDEEGNEYFNIDNPYTYKENNAFSGFFIDRIGDCINAIKEGYGHALMKNFLGNETVCYFLDEKVGTEYRNKSLLGICTSEFKYAVVCYKGCAIGKFFNYLGCDEKSVVSEWDKNQLSIAKYDTEEKAKEKISVLEKLIKQDFRKILKDKSDEETEKLINKHLEETNMKFKVIQVLV